MVVFKKRHSVPSARYSSVCNVLRQWRIWLIPTYRVYRLYDYIRRNILGTYLDTCRNIKNIYGTTYGLKYTYIYNYNIILYICMYIPIIIYI